MNKLLQLLQDSLNDEWEAHSIYSIQAAKLRGLHRDPIGDHFQEHADDEKGHAERLTIHLFSHGVEPDITVPEIKVESDLPTMLERDLKDEMGAIDRYDEIIKICEQNDQIKDTRILIEDILLKEIEHQDELAMLLEDEAPERAQEYQKISEKIKKKILLSKLIK